VIPLLTLLPDQERGRVKRDRLELLTALLTAPGFDPMRGPSVPEIIALVESCPTRFDRSRSCGERPASARRMATVSLATFSHSRKNVLASGSRKMNRALFGGVSWSV